MFVTGLTYQNIIDREPALADLDTSYATSFTGLIAEAKGVIDNRLRALGYDLDKIGKKTDVWDWDNESAEAIERTIVSPESTQLLLILVGTDAKVSEFVVYGKIGPQFFIIPNTIFTLDATPNSFILPFTDTEITVTLNSDGAYDANTIKAYLTDPAIYYVHLYKSLEIIYESMRSNPGDLFEMKSLYYGNLYEREFQNLVTFYDSNGDGIASIGEQQSFNRIDLSR